MHCRLRLLFILDLKRATLEASLLQQIATGDEAAVDKCVDRYSNLIWSLALRMLPTTTDAEDAVQEIFVEVWKNAGRFKPEHGTEKTFILMLARRRLIDWQRRLKRGIAEQTVDSTTVGEATYDVKDAAELQDEVAKARECLESLQQSQRQVLELAIFQGLSQSQIAHRESVPLGTVKTNARRGLLGLRDCMRSIKARRLSGGPAQ